MKIYCRCRCYCWLSLRVDHVLPRRPASSAVVSVGDFFRPGRQLSVVAVVVVVFVEIVLFSCTFHRALYNKHAVMMIIIMTTKRMKWKNPNGWQKIAEVNVFLALEWHIVEIVKNNESEIGCSAKPTQRVGFTRPPVEHVAAVSVTHIMTQIIAVLEFGAGWVM